MIRLPSLLAVIASSLLVVLLAGCASRDSVVQIQIWHNMQPEDRTILAQVVGRYAASNPQVNIGLIYKETEELRSSFQSAALAGLGPALIYGPSDQVGPLATMGFIRPLEELFPAERIAELDSAGVVRYQGHVYQIADRVGNHLALLYNRELLPVPPLNTDEMILAAKAATRDLNGDGRIDQWGLVWNFTEPYWFIPWLSGFGGWVFDEAGQPSLNTRAATDAFRFVKSLRDEHKVIPPDCDYNTADVLFKEGRAAMLINGTWSWAGYEQAGVPFELTPIPQVTATGLWPAPMISSLGYSVNSNTRDKRLEETIRLLEFLVSDAVQYLIVESTVTIPSSLAIRLDSTYINRPHIAQSLAELRLGRPMPIIPEMRAVWDALRPAYQSVLGGYLTPEAAARQAQRLSEEKIREMNEG